MEAPEINSSLRELCKRRPKDKLAKRLGQLLESHLPRIVHEARLCFTLVTVLPDPTASLETSWRVVLDVRDRVRTLVLDLPGMCFSVLALEVHAGSRPKKAAQKRPAPTERQAEEGAEEEIPDVMDLEEEEAPPTSSNEGPKGLQGQPHLHLLVYYPRTTVPALDLSYVKRQLQALLPRSDVNQVHPRSPKGDDRKRIVGAMTYVLKGADCRTRSSILELLHPGTPLHNPTILFGKEWERGSAAGTSMKALLKEMGTTLMHNSEDEAEAAIVSPVYEAPGHKLSKETEALLMVATRVKAEGIRVYNGGYYRLKANSEFTYEYGGALADLPRVISAMDTIMLDLCVRYGSKLNGWYALSAFPHLPSTFSWRFVELVDSVYSIRTGEFLPKSACDDRHLCFRAYDITEAQARSRDPDAWLALVEFAFANTADPLGDADRFVCKMAKLLRARRPKERIMFISGGVNCGKSTLIGWITRLYPGTAICTINDSVAPLSDVKGREILLCDEYSPHKLSRSNLLLLTDGSTGVTVRPFGQAAEYLPVVDMPQLYTCNFGHEPNYKNDTSGAVNARFEFFRLSHEIMNPDLDKAEEIFKETPYIMFYLNRVNRGENN